MNAVVDSSAISSRRRNLLLVAVAVLVLFLITIGMNGIRIGDLWVSIWAVFGILIAVESIRGLRQEQEILVNPLEASATVLRLWRTAYGRGFRIDYEFLAHDGRRYTGTAAALRPIPTEAQAIKVIYRADKPTQSLPRQQFWFHELHASS